MPLTYQPLTTGERPCEWYTETVHVGLRSAAERLDVALSEHAHTLNGLLAANVALSDVSLYLNCEPELAIAQCDVRTALAIHRISERNLCNARELLASLHGDIDTYLETVFGG